MPSSYGLYSPRIEDRNVRRLYRLKIEHRERTGRKVPMTVLVNRILDQFFSLPDTVTTLLVDTRSDTPEGDAT